MAPVNKHGQHEALMHKQGSSQQAHNPYFQLGLTKEMTYYIKKFIIILKFKRNYNFKFEFKITI